MCYSMHIWHVYTTVYTRERERERQADRHRERDERIKRKEKRKELEQSTMFATCVNIICTIYDMNINMNDNDITSGRRYNYYKKN